jgi:hypothetical protein
MSLSNEPIFIIDGIRMTATCRARASSRVARSRAA